MRIEAVPPHYETVIKLMKLVRSRTPRFGGASYPAVCKYNLSGIKITLEKRWFLTSLLSKFKLAGKDWRVLISLSKHPGHPDSLIEFDGSFWYLLDYDIKSQEHMERDLVLLRMFGEEEIFSG